MLNFCPGIQIDWNKMSLSYILTEILRVCVCILLGSGKFLFGLFSLFTMIKFLWFAFFFLNLGRDKDLSWCRLGCSSR